MQTELLFTNVDQFLNDFLNVKSKKDAIIININSMNTLNSST